ncbi:hypothetical protein A0257_03480 [Hymenobacter psoromatis]|nr:hypothetical protein A0257_03480 [Hymenobacter psoromatis]
MMPVYRVKNSLNLLHARHQFAGKNALFFLQTGSVEVMGVDETWDLRHGSSLVKSEKVGLSLATSAADELIPCGPIEKKAQMAVHITIQRCQVDRAATAKVEGKLILTNFPSYTPIVITWG